MTNCTHEQTLRNMEEARSVALDLENPLRRLSNLAEAMRAIWASDDCEIQPHGIAHFSDSIHDIADELRGAWDRLCGAALEPDATIGLEETS